MRLTISILFLGSLLLQSGCARLSPTAAWTRWKQAIASQKRSENKASKQLGPSALTPEQSAEVVIATAVEMEKARCLQEATGLYEKARSVAPNAIDYSSKLCRLYDQLEMNDRAKHEYQKAIAGQPNDAELLNDFGMFHLRRGEAEIAEQWFRKSLRIKPEDSRVLVNLGGAIAMQGRLAESHEIYSRVVGEAGAYSNIGVHLARLGRIEEARTHFEKALSIDGTLEVPRQYLARFESGRIPALVTSN